MFALLVERGYTVALALDGQDALRMAEDIRPDVIVMDLAMPRVDGLECLRRLKSAESTRGIPVVLFSAHAGPELLAVAEAIGCSAVVRKPAGTRAVVDAVTRLAG